MQRAWSKVSILSLALCFWGHAPVVFAAEPLQGEIRFAKAQEEPVWVGQQLELHLEIWSDGFSFGDQLFALPEVPGGFMLQGDSSTIKLSETRSGVAWQGLRYTLLFYPQNAGRMEVPAFDVHFSARAGFGSAPSTFSFRTEPLAVEARLPPGASARSLLVTTEDFELQANWDREVPADGPLRLKTGDALTLEVRRRAAGVPGMVFAPLPAPAIAGLGVYPDRPSVLDQVNRGVLTGTRTDRLTLVGESAGRYVIPEFRFQWWDPGQQQLSERVLPQLELEVETNPAYGDAAAPLAVPNGSRLPWVILAGFLLLLAAWRWLGLSVPLAWLRDWWQSRAGAARHPGRRTGRLLPLNPERGSARSRKPGSA